MVNNFDEGKALCNEIGGAVLTLLGEGDKLSVSNIIEELNSIDINSNEERLNAAKKAIAILSRFIYEDE